MLEPFSRLFSRIEDKRKTKHTVALLSPVGDISMLKEFIFTLKKQSYKDYDLFFIYPKGVEFYKDDDFSILSAEEALPLGTSGCFFAGQAFLYSEGYEVIVVADLDAVPSSKDMLGNLVREASACRCACAPISLPTEGSKKGRGYNVNQYGTYHRDVFEKVGFTTPFFVRGAEDWDMIKRLERKNLIKVLETEAVHHPVSGHTIYHRMVNSKKFYPYLSGFMKAMLLNSERSRTVALRWIFYYVGYRFFSETFQDKGLKYALDGSARFEIRDYPQQAPKFKIMHVKNEGIYDSSFIPRISTNARVLLDLIINGKSLVYNDEIRLQEMSSLGLAKNVALTFLISPLFLAQAIMTFMTWRKERDKIIYPILPDTINEGIERYALFLKKGSI